MKSLISLVAIIICLESNSQNVFKISPGTVLKISHDAFVVSENTSLINDGNLNHMNGRGAFKFIGDSNVSIEGVNSATFSRLIISKTGKATLFLKQPINVTGELNFAGGLLDLNSFNIDLGTTGLFTGENETTHVIGEKGGYIQIIRNLNTPASVNPGNLGAVFSSSQNLGRTVIRRRHQLQANEVAGSTILRSYDITPANGIGLTTKLRFTYLDAELNKADENELVIWRSIDNRNWSNLGFNSRNKLANYVERSMNSGIGNSNGSHLIYHIAVNDKTNMTNGAYNKNSEQYVENSWKVWPNPVVENLWVDINSSVESKATVKIVDDKGALMSLQESDLQPGKNLLKIDMRRMAAGTYLVVVNWADGQMQKGMKIVKMK